MLCSAHILQVCMKKLVECIEKFYKGEIDTDISSKTEKQILTDEIQDPVFLNFTVENINDVFSYIALVKIK